MRVMRLTLRGDGLALGRDELVDAGEREVEHRVELGAVERRVLGGALDLDQLAGRVADDVHVDVGLAILDVGQVEHDLAADDADRDRGDRRRAARLRRRSVPAFDQLADRERAPRPTRR